jgi:hypothetical protein
MPRMEKRVHQFACAIAGIALALTLGMAVAPAAQASCGAPANEIEAENCLPGTSRDQWDVSGAGDTSIQGFATDISVAQGGTVQFKIDTTAPGYRLDIYRMGYYGGSGARFITTVTPNQVRNEDPCPEQASTGLIHCDGWAVSASWTVPTDAVSGIYFAKLVSSTGASSHVPFIVRDDDGGSDLLFQTSDTTWQAYNTYGGNSLYQGSPDNRAYKVSYDRPFVTRGNASEDWVFNAEYPMVRWLERNGYDVSYTTGVDTDRRGSALLSHRVFLSVGHDEYWSGDQRANVEAARDAGVQLGFFSGNEVFWKTRWEDDHRTLVTYKETHANAKIDPTPAWTGSWRDPRFSPPADGGRPENALTGTIFTVNAGSAALQVPAEDGKLRLWRNSPVATQLPGALATLTDGTVGYEWDEDLDNGFRPAGLVRMSSTTVSGVDKLQDYGTNYASGTATHHLTLYRDTNGTGPDALVFGGGTVQWPWGLDAEHDRGSAPADPSMQQATVNLLADMGTQPHSLQSGLQPASASTDTVGPSATITAPAAGASVQQRVPITIQGTAVDAARVGGVEVSVDDGASWHPADGRETWSYTWTPAAPGAVTIRARAVDDSGNLGASSGTTVTVTGRSCPCSLFGQQAPTDATATDSQPVEVGVRFQSDNAGTITALRYFRGPGWTGSFVGHLWNATGGQLAEASFPSASATGWQQVALSQPVRIEAGATYVASFFSSAGQYAATADYFRSPQDAAPLHAPAGGNGVFSYGGGFPATAYQDTNYWADVVFTPDDATPPAVTAIAPGDGSVGIAAGTQVRATFSEPLDPSTVTGSTFRLRTVAGETVPASVAYDGAGRAATLTPRAPLPAGLYTAQVQGVQDLAGNALTAARVWTFTVGAAPPSGGSPGAEPYDRPAGGVRGTGTSSGSLRVGPRRARVSRTGVVKLRVTCSDQAACGVTLRLRVGHRVAAKRTTTVPAGRTRSVRLQLTRATRAKLARTGTLRATAIAKTRARTTRTQIRLIARHATGAA